MNERQQSGGWLIAVGAVTILAAAVRLPWLLEHGYFIDEAFTARDAAKPLLSVLGWRHHDYHPPLSYLLVKAATSVLGSGEPWVLRLPSFLAGVTCVPLACVLGRRLDSRWLGLAFGALIAVEPHLAEQASTARMYSLFTALLLALLLACEHVARSPSRALRPWVWVGTILVALAWTSSAFWIVLASLPLFGAGWWWMMRGKIEPGRWRGAAVAGAMLAVGWLPGLVQLTGSGSNSGDGAGLRAIVWEWLAALSRLFHHPIPGAVLLLLMPLGLGYLAWRRQRPAAALLLACGIVNLVAMLGLRTSHTAIEPRYLMAAQLAALLGFAAVLALGRRRFPVVAHLALAAATIFLLAQVVTFERSDDYALSSRVRHVAAQVQPGDAVVYAPGPLGELGRVSGLPAVPEMTAADLYEFKRSRWRVDETTLPQDRTWLIAYARRDQKGHDVRFRWIVAALGERYGVVIPADDVEAMIDRGEPVILRFERGHFGREK